jgi:two-component system NtrC family sensor kinase
VTTSAHFSGAADTAAAEAILQAARALSAVTAEPGKVATVIAEIVLAQVAADGVVVAELDGASFRVEGGAGNLARLSGECFRAEGSLALRAITDQRAVLKDAAGPLDECELARRVHAREVLAAPMFAGGVPVGTVIAIRCADGSFTPRDVTTAERLAELASLAMHNARLLERERQGARGATALANIVHELNQSLEFERVVSIVAEKALSLLNGRASVLTILDGDELVIAATAGVTERFIGRRWPVDESFTGACLRAGRPLRTTDVRAETTFPMPTSEGDDYSTAIAAPLLVADRPIGALVVAGIDGRVFTEHDEEMLRALASHGAIAIENSRLYRAAAHTARHAETLSMAAKSLSESVVPGGFFEDLFRVAHELLGADGLSVYAIDPDRRVARVVYVAGAGTPPQPPAGARILEEEISDLPEAQTEAFHSDIRDGDAERVRRWKPHVLLDDIVAVARLPLMVEGRLRGALTLRWKSRRSFGDDDRILLRDFATQVAIALRNADLIADLDRRAQRFSAIARMQQVISRVELREVYGEVTRSARTAVPQAQAVALLALSADGGTFLPQVIVADDAVAWAIELHPVTVADCAASEAVRRRERITTTAPQRSWPDYVPRLASRPMRAEIAVPMLHGDEPSGVLIVQSDDPHAFSSEDGDVLALLARQAGTAIENARLFEAERRTREIAEAAAEISRAALASRGTDQTARQVLDTIDRVVPSPGKALALMDVSGTLLRYVAASGALSPLHQLVVSVDQSATSLVSGPEPVVAGLAALMGIREGEIVSEGATLFPLIAKSRVLGVLWSLPSGVDDYSVRLRSLTAPLALAADVLLLDEEERKRREREQTLATAVATMQQPILIAGLDRRVLYANAAAVDEYGYSVEDFAGLTLDRLIDSWVPARPVAPGGLDHGAGTWAAEQVHRRKDDTTFPASVLMSAIRDEAGVSVGQVVAVRNLTEEHRIQEQLRQTEKLAALGELVAGVAHELNNPLAGISAFAQLMMDDELADEHHESVRLIKREADRAVGVIRDLLTFARKTGPTRSLIDVNEMVELTLRLRGYSLRSAGIDLQVDLESALPAVPGDDQRLQQVLLNLIVNAEYALQRAERKHLAVRTERDGDGVALYVTDSGVGMAEEVRQRIFEPFFTTKSAGEGTGLGLSVSYGIVRAHGGTITVESTPGEGTTFRVFLPVVGRASALA